MNKVKNKVNLMLANMLVTISSMKDDERGVSPVVATVLILLMTVLLVGLFWTPIKAWVTTMLGIIISSTPV